MRRNINWNDAEQVRAYKRNYMRNSRGSTRTLTKRNINWNDPKQVRAYKRANYAKNYCPRRWPEIVKKYLELL